MVRTCGVPTSRETTTGSTSRDGVIESWSSIKHHEVDRLHKELAKAKSNVTANIALKLLHVMFNKAINEWRIYAGDNPARGIRKLREISRDRFLQPEEMPLFLMAVALEPSPDPETSFTSPY